MEANSLSAVVEDFIDAKLIMSANYKDNILKALSINEGEALCVVEETCFTYDSNRWTMVSGECADVFLLNEINEMRGF